jgi:arsenate reductase-like glutaredoxin family protein
MTIGFDLDEIINMFRFHRNRNLQFLQNRLLAQEQEKYVNNRFTKKFVQKLTHLEGDELIKFMNFSRPTYEMLGLLNDLELGLYIEKRFASYRKGN